MILALVLNGCGPSGSAFVVSESFDGPAEHVTADDGEVVMQFVIAVEPVGTSGPAPRLDYGFDVAWTVTTAGPATVRFVTTTDAETWVPTPWEVSVNGAETFAQSSVAHPCGRGDERCEQRYATGIELREGDAVDVTWTVAMWAEGRPGSVDKISDDTVLDVGFE